MSKPRLAIIGTGNIAHFHCEAFLEAGFEITHAAGSKNSKNILPFGEKFSIKNVYSDPNEIIKNHKNWDLVLLSTPTEYNFDYLDSIIKFNKTALIEKPVATTPEDLSKFKIGDLNHIRVAYNRRFYSTIQAAKKFIADGETTHARMELPEGVNIKGNYTSVLLNSAHGIDLLLYLFGDLEIINNSHFKNDCGRLVTLKSINGDIVNLTMNWNSPSNFIINIEGGKKRLEIKPFEDSQLYKGMQVIEPSKELPLRRYIPQEIESISSYPNKNNLIKPGFLEQALEMKNILNGEDSKVSASLYDAYKVQKLLQAILY